MANPDQQTFEQWISSLQKLLENPKEDHPEDGPYTILLEYSQYWSLRTQTDTAEDVVTYARAGLRTPATNAARDYWGGPLWIEFLLACFLRSSAVDWLSHVPWTAGRRKRLQQQTGKIQCIDTLSLATAPVLVVDSLLHLSSPEFLSDVGAAARIRLLPLRTDTIPLRTLRRWEDASHAILHVHEGHVTLLRRGRERGSKWIRATLDAYDLVDSAIVWNEEAVAATTTPGATETTKPGNSTDRIQLEWQDGARQLPPPRVEKVTPQKPRITVDDDDPEFDDYDAEDPDDDLDL